MTKIIIFIALLVYIFSFNTSMAQDKKVIFSETVEVLWQDYLNQQLDPIEFYAQRNSLSLKELSITDQIRLIEITQYFENNKNMTKLELTSPLTQKEALRIASEWKFIEKNILKISTENKFKINEAQKDLNEINKFRVKTTQEIEDLFYETPDYAYYQNGSYKDTLKLFLFCRHDRRYPCLFALKDIFDRPVRNKDGSLWTLPALAHSRRELPYNITNGYTPSGVHTMDSVMPEANRQRAFGKYRRVILNWIPQSKNDHQMKYFLPQSAMSKKWWKEASIARDVGRKWLRIHGTGNRNTNPQSLFYPHFATSGCISTKEMQYDGIEYKDQRILLNKMMNSMQMAPIYRNEVKIKGVLYVIELDDKKEKVTAKSLERFGLD